MVRLLTALALFCCVPVYLRAGGVMLFLVGLGAFSAEVIGWAGFYGCLMLASIVVGVALLVKPHPVLFWLAALLIAGALSMYLPTILRTLRTHA